MKILSFIFLLLLQSCAIGPLYHHESARTLGSGRHDVTVGAGKAGYTFKWNAGLLNFLDLGMHLESFSAGLKAKLGIINNQEGFALSTGFGVGASIGGQYKLFDLNTSYKQGWFEPYLTLRYVSVTIDKDKIKDKDTGDLVFTFFDDKYEYYQPILGTLFWLGDKLHLSAELSMLHSKSNNMKLRNNFIYGASLGYRF